MNTLGVTVLQLRRRQVVVNLTSGRVFVGERRLSWPWQVVLVSAETRPAGVPSAASPVTVDGRVVIPRRQVEFVQVVT